MEKILYVLLIEDSIFDAELIAYSLQKSGIITAFERVCNESAMRTALSKREWNLILSDHLMPSFDSIEALRVRNEICPEKPFIIVSSCLEDNLAEAAYKKGCTACVPKSSLDMLAKVIKDKLELI